MSEPAAPRRAAPARARAFPIVVAVLVLILIAAIVVAYLLLRDPAFTPIPIPTVSSA